jgi:hypothetical protein
MGASSDPLTTPAWRGANLRYSWTDWMAIAPAPTAEATLLTDPYLTSPAAKGGGGDSLGGPGGGVFQHEPLEPPPPAAAHHAGVQTDVDVLGGLYLRDQVL